MVNSNETECFILGPSTETNANNHGNSNFDNRPDSTPYQTIIKLKISFQDQAKSDKKKALK